MVCWGYLFESDDEFGLSGRRRVQEKQVGNGKMIYPLNELREIRIQSQKLSRTLQKKIKKSWRYFKIPQGVEWGFLAILSSLGGIGRPDDPGIHGISGRSRLGLFSWDLTVFISVKIHFLTHHRSGYNYFHQHKPSHLPLLHPDLLAKILFCPFLWRCENFNSPDQMGPGDQELSGPSWRSQGFTVRIFKWSCNGALIHSEEKHKLLLF